MLLQLREHTGNRDTVRWSIDRPLVTKVKDWLKHDFAFLRVPVPFDVLSCVFLLPGLLPSRASRDLGLGQRSRSGHRTQ